MNQIFVGFCRHQNTDHIRVLFQTFPFFLNERKNQTKRVRKREIEKKEKERNVGREGEKERKRKKERNKKVQKSIVVKIL